MTSICFTFSFLTLSVVAFAAESDGYWRQVTPDRTQSRVCEVVRNEDELVKSLKILTWDLKAAPSVDWSRSAVVIIAPERFYRGYALSLIGLTNGEVRWGFRRPALQVRDTKSESIGAGKEGLETIVIAFPKGSASSVSCREIRE